MYEGDSFVVCSVDFEVDEEGSLFECIFVFACEGVEFVYHEALLVWVYFDAFDSELDA